MQKLRYLKHLVLNRNSTMVFSVASNICVGKQANKLKFLTFPTLANTITLSISGTSLLQLKNEQRMFNPILNGIFMNYILFSLINITFTSSLMPTQEHFYGFAVITATPSGVAIIPD